MGAGAPGWGWGAGADGVGCGVVLSGAAMPVAFISLQPLVWTHTAKLTTWLPKCRLEQPAALSLAS